MNYFDIIFIGYNYLSTIWLLVICIPLKQRSIINCFRMHKEYEFGLYLCMNRVLQQVSISANSTVSLVIPPLPEFLFLYLKHLQFFLHNCVGDFLKSAFICARASDCKQKPTKIGDRQILRIDIPTLKNGEGAYSFFKCFKWF